MKRWATLLLSKTNRLHKDMEKGSVSFEIRHGQKSKSHHRMSREDMKQFWFVNICNKVLEYAHDTSL